MINCSQIIEHEGINHLLDRSVFNRDSLVLQDKLGDRHEGALDINCFNVSSNSYIEISSSVYNNFSQNVFETGFFVYLPSSSNTGSKHPLVYKKDGDGVGYELYEQSGNLYFSIGDGDVTQEVNTEASGLDFCDDSEHVVFLKRKYDKDNSDNFIIEVNVYKEYKNSTSVSKINIDNSANIYLMYDGTNNVSDGVKINNFFFTDGGNLKENEYYAFAKCGMVQDPAGLYKLDEGIGRIVFDSSGYLNHGKIVNYDLSVWDIMEFGVSYPNLFGYSTGLYVKNNGVSSTISVLGEDLSVEDSVIVPSILFNSNEGIFGNSLEYEGRLAVDSIIKDISCYRANGSVYGTTVLDENIISDVSGDWSFIALLEKIPNEGGTIFTYGQSSDFKLKVSFVSDPYYDNLEIQVGDVTNSYIVADGMVQLMLNFSGGTCNVDVNDGEITDSFLVGSPTTGGSDQMTLFAEHDGLNILTDANVIFAGIREDSFSTEEKSDFFSDYFIPADMSSIYIPMSHGDIIFDVGFNGYHASLQNYNSEVWNGVQSVFPYFRRGFVKAYESRENLSNYIFIPKKINGNYLYYDNYGENQLNVVFDTREGLLMYDYYINMNYLNKTLGFYTKFFNKNSDVWASLDLDYDNGNSYDWHCDEFDYSYIQSSLNVAYENYLFIRNIYRQGTLIGFKDLILMNTGLDIKPKSVPL